MTHPLPSDMKYSASIRRCYLATVDYYGGLGASLNPKARYKSYPIPPEPPYLVVAQNEACLLGVPIIRIIVLWGLCGGPHILGNYPISLFRNHPKP